MTDKKIYFGLGTVALLALLVTAALVYKAGRLSQSELGVSEPVATSAAEQGREANTGGALADLILNFGEKLFEGRRIATYSAVRSPQRTALDLLLEVAQQNNFVVEYDQQSFGAFIKSIGGVTNQRSIFWLYYVNGLPAPVAADKQIIKDGDVVEFRFTSTP